MMLKSLRNIIEANVFGVCAYLGEKMGVATRRVRLHFIYATFFTFGSPVVIYMAIAFWLNIKSYVKNQILPVFDL